MANLSELNKAINALNDLWPLLDGEEKAEVLIQRDNLNSQASTLAHKALMEGVPELTAAIDQLNLVTQTAKEARQSINITSQRIIKVSKTIEKASSAVGKVTKLLALL